MKGKGKNVPKISDEKQGTTVIFNVAKTTYLTHLRTYIHTYLLTYLLTYSIHDTESFLRS